MPSSLNSGPFLSLRPDSECGRSKVASPKSFASLSGTASPTTNGYSNGYSHTNGHGSLDSKVNGNGHSSHDDEFLRLDAPQQDLLLLHGPRQKYKLEKSKEIPDLQGEREILVQVLAIGLNPVDWKGADYGFSQPSYPWVNGRDFAGIVVRAPRTDSRIKQGDVVFGPSTDYRDVRKAAYQEYVVTTDYNVSRIPQGVDVKEGAALGVAWVAAVVSLGISFGVNFSTLRNAPQGPDLVQLVRGLDPREVPEDIRDEIFSGIPHSERPQPGEWIAIWGANSMTGQVALQLAKHAGLKVACIADIARGGARLSELGADFMVDKYDDKRAIDILKAVTGGKLRFGFDCNGKDSATSLQEALTQTDSGLKSHLLGLAGLPKSVGRGVVHHKVPIKIFHEAPSAGEAISTWLEKLLVSRSLKLPEVEVAQGGLAGINDALDRMRTGTIGGKRIVVAVGSESKEHSPSPSNGVVPNGIASKSTDPTTTDFSYADSLNSDPDRVRFAYWVPNVSGGMVISKIAQRTHWDHKSNYKYAQTAERVGFEYALSQIRFMAGYGADNQHEPLTLSQAILMKTERLKLIVALLPGPWNPAIAAKACASLDNITDGRVAVNVVSGWFKLEFTSIGQWWLDHAERYRRSKEFIQCLKGIWTQESFNFKGDFYQFHDYPLKPKPLNLPGRPYPEIFQGGNSDDAKENAGSVSDYYFMNGNTLEGFRAQIHDVKDRAKKNGREGEVGFALNAFVICRDTEEEALNVLAEIQGKANVEAVEGFRQQVANAGSSTSNKSGMWANSSVKDLVQYNDGFKTKLIGTKEQIAERIVMLKSLGVNIILTAFLHYEEEIEHFGREIIPLVRELEKRGRGKDEEDEVRRTGWIYEDTGFATNRIPPPALPSTSSPAVATTFAAAAPNSQRRPTARPFASLMLPSTDSLPPFTSAAAKQQESANTPHRPLPASHRNSGGEATDVERQSVYQPKRSFASMNASAVDGRADGAHRPFAADHRNPEEALERDATTAAAGVQSGGVHRPFAVEYRNPGALDSDSKKEKMEATPHRPFPPSHRNPEVQDTAPAAPAATAAAAARQTDDAHQPFPPSHRNPAETLMDAARPAAAATVDSEVRDGEVLIEGIGEMPPHRPFTPTHRNTGSGQLGGITTTSPGRGRVGRPTRVGSAGKGTSVGRDEAHRPFGAMLRNSEGQGAVRVEGSVVEEENAKAGEAHRAFDAAHRNASDTVASSGAVGDVSKSGLVTSNDKDLEEKNAEAKPETRQQSAVSTALPSSANRTQESKKVPHLPSAPEHRNANAPEQTQLYRPIESYENPQAATTGPKSAQTSSKQPQQSPAPQPQTATLNQNPISPAPSEKSFATAEGDGSSSSGAVHVRLSDAEEAENGKAEKRKDGELAVPPKTSNGSASGKEGERKGERGLLRGLKNSLRRKR